MKNTITPMEDYSYISKNIKNFRKRLKLRQSDMAEMLGVSQATISNWENGKKTLYLHDAMGVIEILGMDILKKQNYF